MVQLVDFFLEKNLAWRDVGPSQHESDWCWMHPHLAAAVMSSVALSIAEDKGLDIVTDSARTHRGVIARTENGILASLLNLPITPDERDETDKVDELAQFFFTTAFNLNKLTAQNIADLLNDGKDLRQFKRALLPIAASIPSIRDDVEREKRLREASREIVEQWSLYRRSLPRFAVDAMMEADFKPPELLSGLAAGAATIPIDFGAGLILGMATYNGVRIWRKYQDHAANPYRYLCRVHGLGATLIIPPP